MSDIIRLLPDNIANQIAAGEVVQRPASVVKELLENALDAGATTIKLIVKDAGKQLVQVIDNGKGMSSWDARKCFERHATSKIATADDLFALFTFGFRGEAMASIAAVAQVELKTRMPLEETGTYVRIEASEVLEHQTTATLVGTSISVKNLFYNVPARRNFLKSNPVEMRHIMEEFTRAALAYPSIAFSMYHNDLEIFQLQEESLSKRIINVLGQSYREQQIPCKEETDVVQIHGYIGKPESAKKSKGDQFFFVNNRYIKSGYLHHAIQHAYEDLVPSDAYPFYVLFLQVPPHTIDVNVHPTKTEIKFEDEKTIYAILKASIKKALGSHNMVPSLDFDFDVNVSSFAQLYPDRSAQKDPADIGIQTKYKSSGDTFSGGARWDILMQQLDDNRTEPEQTQVFNEGIRLSSKINSPTTFSKEELFLENPATFQLHQRYIISHVKSGVLLVDQQAAHERILFEKYEAQLTNKLGISQQFLFPQTLQLSPSDFVLVKEMEDDLKKVGFVINTFSNDTIVINGVPADGISGKEKDLFEGLIEQFKTNRDTFRLSPKENLARSLAKRSAIKSGTKLTVMEMNALIDQLFACKTPNFAPDGNQTLILLDMQRIAQMFQ
ncbi:MAG: DNA mismatch repair endonuclease MutL [Cytophagaceae bacterium]|jgi:DNA mismatch repair protein MutL|nr:DNA mismatch repair endonuclease MutL [Cytophagaceae bacterium]